MIRIFFTVLGHIFIGLKGCIENYPSDLNEINIIEALMTIHSCQSHGVLVFSLSLSYCLFLWWDLPTINPAAVL